MSLINIESCRNALMRSMAHPDVGADESLIVYSFREDCRYSTHYTRTSRLEELAELICKDENDKLVCNGDDWGLFNTNGSEFDMCIAGLSESFLSELREKMCQYKNQM